VTGVATTPQPKHEEIAWQQGDATLTIITRQKSKVYHLGLLERMIENGRVPTPYRTNVIQWRKVYDQMFNPSYRMHRNERAVRIIIRTQTQEDVILDANQKLTPNDFSVIRHRIARVATAYYEQALQEA
jgi:hypothetical protein